MSRQIVRVGNAAQSSNTGRMRQKFNVDVTNLIKIFQVCFNHVFVTSSKNTNLLKPNRALLVAKKELFIRTSTEISNVIARIMVNITTEK
jgi:hypothetical protein